MILTNIKLGYVDSHNNCRGMIGSHAAEKAPTLSGGA